MASVKLTYTDPEISSSTSATFTNMLIVKGWYDVDSLEFFPGIQHRYLSGSIDEQIAGLRRAILLDFGVVSTFALRKAILYFCKDTARQINLVITAPTGFSATPSAGGSLPATTHYYRVSAVDAVGETIGATEDSAVNAAANLQNDLVWNPVSGATSYRIYRSTVSGNYDGTKFLIETTSTSYTDTGAVSLTSTYQLPSVQALTVALQNFQSLVAEWLDGYQEAKRFSLVVLDSTLRDELIP